MTPLLAFRPLRHPGTNQLDHSPFAQSPTASVHLTVTNTWMNTHTELELPADPVFWLNSALCGGNGKTSVQKLWVIEQMDCGRAGWNQDDAEAGMQAGLAHMEASMVASMASMVASMASMVAPMASMASVVAPMA